MSAEGAHRNWSCLPWSVDSPPPIGVRILEQWKGNLDPSHLDTTLTFEKIGPPNTKEISSDAQVVQSIPLTITKENGRKIQAFQDSRTHSSSKLPVIVVAPGYGETKRDYLTLAYYLATNGFRVVRYDHTNHVGASDGNHIDFTLSSMKEDFQTVSSFARVQWPACQIIGLASSMAARVVVKAESERPSVDYLVMLMGIVNVRRTVAAVHLEDVFAGFAAGQYPESANILGLNVGQQFLQDACHNHFVTLEDSLQDAKRLVVPVMMWSAGKDAWVEKGDLQTFQCALGNRLRKNVVVRDSLHRVQENPKLARHIYRQVVESCREVADQSNGHPLALEPDRLILGRQHRREKQAQIPMQPSEMGAGFWKDYLQNFQSVGNCEDYLSLLDHVLHALGPVRAGNRILDAGCGNGTAALSLFHAVSQWDCSSIENNPIRYVGVDMIPDGLHRIKYIMELMASSRQEKIASPSPRLHTSWARMDLHASLPFPDSSFDRILSNLVLGYVKTPEVTLKELYRVLAPGGRMVISNLKPDGDFSGIYQRLVNHAKNQQERTQARELLNNYGKIRQAEKDGQFHFFHREQWRQILDSLGQQEAQIYPTFANQAYLIVIHKPLELSETGVPSSKDASSFFSKKVSSPKLRKAA